MLFVWANVWTSKWTAEVCLLEINEATISIHVFPLKLVKMGWNLLSCCVLAPISKTVGWNSYNYLYTLQFFPVQRHFEVLLFYFKSDLLFLDVSFHKPGVLLLPVFLWQTLLQCSLCLCKLSWGIVVSLWPELRDFELIIECPHVMGIKKTSLRHRQTRVRRWMGSHR